MIKCRQSDESLVREVMDQAGNEYKELMQKEVKAFKGKEIPLNLEIDEKRKLPEYSDNPGSDSCMGGIVMHARKGRIVCSNTLDERL